MGEKISGSKLPAEMTLEILRNCQGCSYSYVTGSMDRANSLITIRKGSWKMGLTSPKDQSSAARENHDEETMEVTKDDERARYVKNMINGLSLG